MSSDQAAQAFDDGVYFVPLAPATDLNGLAASVSQIILPDLYGSNMAPKQLISFLAEKRLLLVLDNLEHLADAGSLLADLLPEAPDVKLLVTSREALNLAEAWLYPVGGLPVTPEDHGDYTEPTNGGHPPLPCVSLPRGRDTNSPVLT